MRFTHKSKAATTTAIAVISGMVSGICFGSLSMPSGSSPFPKSSVAHRRISPKKLRPSFAKASHVYKNPNQSFLNDLKSTENFNDSILNGKWISEGKAAAMRNEFELRSRQYEMKKNFGQASMEDQRAYESDMGGISQKLVSEIGKEQFKSRVTSKLDADEIQDEAKKAPTAVKTTAAVIAVLAAAGTGQMVKVQLEKDTRLMARTDLTSKKGEVKLTTPWINTGFDYQGQASQQVSVNRNDGSVVQERFRLMADRGIPVWNLRSGVVYGGTSNTVSATLVKPLAPGLSAAVSSSKQLDNNAPAVTTAGQSVSVNYEVRF